LADYGVSTTTASSSGGDPERSKLANEHLTFVGPILLALSTSLDSIIPNLQERLFQQSNAKTVDMIFLANVFMFAISSVYASLSGELADALVYCQQNPRVLGVLTIQAASAYFGLQCYLTVIKSYGGVGGVLLANARKIFTIVLSFLVFSKPCQKGHLYGLCLIFGGVYVGVVANRKAKTTRRAVEQKDSVDEEEDESPRTASSLSPPKHDRNV
jgi:hypothetical protein